MPFVYALNAEKKNLPVAVSFPDEKSAKDAYLSASEELDEGNTGVFRFGYTSKSQIHNDMDVLFNNATAELAISFRSLPIWGYPEGVETHRIFSINEFEEAEKRAEKILSDFRYRQPDIQFMRRVKNLPLAPETENAVGSEPNPQPVYIVDKPKSLAKEGLPDFSKGFWLSAQEFADRKGCKVSALKKQRETKSGARMLIENGKYMRDGKGNILRKTKDTDNSPYEYFVLYD